MEGLEDVIDYIDIILLNSVHDAEKLLGLASPDKIIKFFWDRGVSMVAVKMGAQGSTVGYNGEINHIPSCVSKLIDTTGAGDAYNGAILHGIASGYTLFESAKLACVVAALQIQTLGAIKSVPYRDQVYADFKRGDM